jgi:transposase-like protein
VWKGALEQRRTLHALGNVTKKLPKRLRGELKARYWRIFDEAGSAAEARSGLLALAAEYRVAYPSAAAVSERDLDALICRRFPSEDRKRISTMTPRAVAEIERLRRDCRRTSTKRAPGASSPCLDRARTLQPRLTRDRDSAEVSPGTAADHLRQVIAA